MKKDLLIVGNRGDATKVSYGLIIEALGTLRDFLEVEASRTECEEYKEFLMSIREESVETLENLKKIY